MKGDIKKYTSEEITEMADTWSNYNGFSGETCGNCHRTANVLALGPGWICECEHFNVQSWSHANMPHENPDLGPARSVIQEGHKASKKYAAFLQNIENKS